MFRNLAAKVPDGAAKLVAAQLSVTLQAGAGAEAFIGDEAYQKAGAKTFPDARQVLAVGEQD